MLYTLNIYNFCQLYLNKAEKKFLKNALKTHTQFQCITAQAHLY